MTDKELLELAAKAAGMPLGYEDGEYFWCKHGPFGESMYGRRGNAPLHWNPLADDGDALRLAVSLNLSIMYGAAGIVQVSADDGGDHCTAYALEDLEGADPMAATRRAITRAAASIGAAGGGGS